MALISLIEPNETYWLMVSVDDADATELKHRVECDLNEADLQNGWSGFNCRRRTADWFEEIRKRHTKWTADRAGRFEETNWTAYRKEMLRELVTEWRGIPGDPPCTEENKQKLPQPVQLLIIGQASQRNAAPDRRELQKNF